MGKLPIEASGAVTTPSASTAETATAVSGLEDAILDGSSHLSPHANDLLSLLMSGQDPTVTFIMIQRHLADKEATEEALSNTMAAYHRMAMAVIGNMKA